MPSLDCRAVVWSQDPSVAQIMTGLVMLARQGEIRLRQDVEHVETFRPYLPPHLQYARESAFRLLVERDLRLYIDVHDGHQIDEEAARSCDLYFKRSYAPDRLPTAVAHKIRPLGLNYEIHATGVDLCEARRIFAFSPGVRVRRTLKFVGKSLLASVGRGPHITTARLTSAPVLDLEPRVLLMTAVYDPDDIQGHVPELIAERRELNHMRVACVRLLRKELGELFFGGVQHSAFARREYPDALLANGELADKRAYLSLLRNFPICIATTGLHGSIGWKLAEYVAMSKAIVTEPLKYGVPGGFGEPANYLTFSSPEECLEKVTMLIEDADLRGTLMTNNARYYADYARPDALVRHMLDTAAGTSSVS
jgi:hypothetical protein